eukprot:41583-Prymnesium_polylepis.1
MQRSSALACALRTPTLLCLARCLARHIRGEVWRSSCVHQRPPVRPSRKMGAELLAQPADLLLAICAHCNGEDLVALSECGRTLCAAVDARS